MDSTPWIRDSVSETYSPESNRYYDSGFLKLYSLFQIPGFRIPQAKISGIRECLFPYKGWLNGHFRDTFTLYSTYL